LLVHSFFFVLFSYSISLPKFVRLIGDKCDPVETLKTQCAEWSAVSGQLPF